MTPRETKNNAYAKLWGDIQIALWYVVAFCGAVNCLIVLQKASATRGALKAYGE